MNTVGAYERVVYPLIDRYLHVDAEEAHHAVINLLHVIEQHPQWLFLLGQLLTPSDFAYTNDRLKTSVGGVNFPNPLLLPAGYDKDGEAVRAFFALGFGAVEVGTVTAEPQAGNDKPRVFRPEKGTLLNRYGFNSAGALAVSQNLHQYENRKGALGISLGKNKLVSRDEAPEAHRAVLRHVIEGADFFIINVSSPNTPDLRKLQTSTYMQQIINACVDEMTQRGIKKPIFIKLAPDLTFAEVDEILNVTGIAGIMLTNTSNNVSLKERLGQKWADEAGGVSGRPIREMSTRLIAHVHDVAPSLPIIGMGGVDDIDSLMEKFAAGASAVGFLSALVSKGPSLPSQLLMQLDRRLKELGATNVSQIVGQRNIAKGRYGKI